LQITHYLPLGFRLVLFQFGFLFSYSHRGFSNGLLFHDITKAAETVKNGSMGQGRHSPTGLKPRCQ
jgi:hypothetical protein